MSNRRLNEMVLSLKASSLLALPVVLAMTAAADPDNRIILAALYRQAAGGGMRRTSGEQPVDITTLLLAVSPDAGHGLLVVGGVPVTVQESTWGKLHIGQQYKTCFY